MKHTIKIAKNFSLPDDAVTQTIGSIGRKGSGKTYLAGVLVEGLIAMGAQVIVLDPIGNWWGLRLGANGTDKGCNIPVIGGDHGDLPIQPEAGQLIADLLVDNHLSAVLDVSEFSKNKRKQFVADFATQFFQRKKKERGPVHLVLEESQLFAPQRVQKGEERMLGAIEDLVRLGRNYGIGCTLISQRPQSVHKDVLNQVEALFALQLSGAHERKAIEQWVVDKGIDVKAMVQELPALRVGEAFLWSPQWLKVLQKLRIAKKTTFDGSSTPDFKKARRVEPRKLKARELADLNQAMASVVEEKKASDPRLLKQEIIQLKMQLNEMENLAISPDQAERFREEGKRQALNSIDSYLKRLDKFQLKFQDKFSTLQRELTVLGETFKEFPIFESKPLSDSSKVRVSACKGLPDKGMDGLIRAMKLRPEVPVTAAEVVTGEVFTKGCLKKIKMLVQMHPRKLSIKQLATLCGYSAGSGSFTSDMSQLRKAGLIAGEKNALEPTETALNLYGNGESVPNDPQSLVAFWNKRLPLAAQRILEELVRSPGQEISRGEMAGILDYSVGSGSFTGAIGLLVKNGLAENSGGMLKASDTLFAGV